MIWTQRVGDELYVWHGPTLIYKRWYYPGTNVRRHSRVFCHWTPYGA